MDEEKHYRALERMYLAGPINKIFNPQIAVSCERAIIEIDVKESLFHAGGAVHGAAYFKMLDDAAYFAASSIEPDFFMLTASFKINFTKPVSTGRMRSIGNVVREIRKQIIADSVVYDGDGIEIGRGSGVFVRGKLSLVDVMGYKDV
jgi:uncharacterized protein (TIGR00369 family)